MMWDFNDLSEAIGSCPIEVYYVRGTLSLLERSFITLGPSVDSHCRASSIKSPSLDYITEISVLAEDLLRRLTEESETTVFASNRRINFTGLFLVRSASTAAELRESIHTSVLRTQPSIGEYYTKREDYQVFLAGRDIDHGCKFLWSDHQDEIVQLYLCAIHNRENTLRKLMLRDRNWGQSQSKHWINSEKLHGRRYQLVKNVEKWEALGPASCWLRHQLITPPQWVRRPATVAPASTSKALDRTRFLVGHEKNLLGSNKEILEHDKAASRGNKEVAKLLLDKADLKQDRRSQDSISEVEVPLNFSSTSQFSSDFRDLLKELDAPVNHNVVWSNECPGTGKWPLKSSDLSRRSTERSPILLKGVGGAGKLALSTALQSVLLGRVSDPRTGIVVFYRTFNERSRRNELDLLRALLLHLSSQLQNDELNLGYISNSHTSMIFNVPSSNDDSTRMTQNNPLAILEVDQAVFKLVDVLSSRATGNDATDAALTPEIDYFKAKQSWRDKICSLSNILGEIAQYFARTILCLGSTLRSTLLSTMIQRVTVPLMILFADPTTAELPSALLEGSEEMQESAARLPILGAVNDFLREIIGLFGDPYIRNTHKRPSPGILLLGCFLCTSFAVMTAFIHKSDRYQRQFLLASAVLLAVEGSFFAVDSQDFVFRYMFLNIYAGLGLSMLFHRGIAFFSHKSNGMPVEEKSMVQFGGNRSEKEREVCAHQRYLISPNTLCSTADPSGDVGQKL